MDAIHSGASSSSLHVVFGSGGTKAILAGTGAVLAFRIAGLTDWRSIGCASGGSIPAALLASGKEPAEFLRHVIETEFDRLVVPRRSIFGRIFAIIRKYHYEHSRPTRGAYGTDLFKQFIDTTVPSWPERFWTVAACAHGQVLFKHDGVYKYDMTSCRTLYEYGRFIAPEPPSLGLAVVATCAIPGILDAVQYRDEYLFDGALSGDGDCPIGVVPRHFGAGPQQIVAIDMGEESIKNRWWLRLLWRLGCLGRCRSKFEGSHPEDGDALLIIRPQISGFHALQFSLSKDLKWTAVIGGFVATARALADSELLSDENKRKVLHFADELQGIEAASAFGQPLACRVEAFLAEHGLFTPTACVR